MVRTSSTGIKNGLSFSRFGVGIYVSTASINAKIFFCSASSPFKALTAAPRITGILSPGNPYLLKVSRISISTISINSLSSTKSTLFKKTTMNGTPTWRARRMCSLVCAMTPSLAATTKIPPSICAAPVIMFLT